MTCPKRGADWYKRRRVLPPALHTWSPDDRIRREHTTTHDVAAFRGLWRPKPIWKASITTPSGSATPQGRPHQPAERHHGLLLHERSRLFRRMPIYHSGERRSAPPQYGARTYRHVETLLKNAIPALAKKSSLVTPEDCYIKQLPRRRCWPSLYFNAEAYIGEEPLRRMRADLPRHHRRPLYGDNELDDTWYAPTRSTTTLLHEAIWNVPSENSKV